MPVPVTDSYEYARGTFALRSPSDGTTVLPHVDDKGHENIVTLSASVVEIGVDDSFHHSFLTHARHADKSIRPRTPRDILPSSDLTLAFGMSPESQARMFKVNGRIVSASSVQVLALMTSVRFVRRAVTRSTGKLASKTRGGGQA